MMSSPDPRHRDARDCLRCDIQGILPLGQDSGQDAVPGTVDNPLMICLVCDQEVQDDRHDVGVATRRCRAHRRRA
jgi:hypothetical protein